MPGGDVRLAAGQKGACVAIFDATKYDEASTTFADGTVQGRERRERNDVSIVFVESICDDPKVLSRNYEMKLQNVRARRPCLWRRGGRRRHDACACACRVAAIACGVAPNAIAARVRPPPRRRGGPREPTTGARTPTKKAQSDFMERVKQYEARYEPVDDAEEHAYIKLVNVGDKVITRRCGGYLTSQLGFYLGNVHIQPRRIWLALHGESATRSQAEGSAPPRATSRREGGASRAAC